jgi:hypothetical protein
MVNSGARGAKDEGQESQDRGGLYEYRTYYLPYHTQVPTCSAINSASTGGEWGDFEISPPAPKKYYRKPGFWQQTGFFLLRVAWGYGPLSVP